MVRLIFLGPPGAGKGTQATLLAKNFAIPHISTGDILRAAVTEKTDLGMKAQSYMDRGELVPDQLLLGMIRSRLSQPDAQVGWILDGFPRNLPQADFLDQLLLEIHQSCDAVVNIDVPDEVLISRLLERGRKDDNEEVIRRRLDVYRNQTAPLIDAYHSRQKLVSINGNQPIDTVTAELQHLIQSK